MRKKMFQKKDYKTVKSFGLSNKAIEKLEEIKEYTGLSKSQIVEDLILFYDLKRMKK
jgi:hypothetical protein